MCLEGTPHSQPELLSLAGGVGGLLEADVKQREHLSLTLVYLSHTLAADASSQVE